MRLPRQLTDMRQFAGPILKCAAFETFLGFEVLEEDVFACVLPFEAAFFAGLAALEVFLAIVKNNLPDWYSPLSNGAQM